MSQPRIAITVGDPAGIGPEIAAKAAADPRVRAECDPIVYGPEDGRRFAAGVLSGEAGRAAYGTIRRALRDAPDGKGNAIATPPVNKPALSRARPPSKGPTELPPRP